MKFKSNSTNLSTVAKTACYIQIKLENRSYWYTNICTFFSGATCTSRSALKIRERLFDVCTLYRKEDSGNYSCQAYNVEGQVESATQQLIVMCKCFKYHSYIDTSITHFGDKSTVSCEKCRRFYHKV